MKKYWEVVWNKEAKENEIRIDGDIGESIWGWLFDQDEVTAKAFREELKAFKGKNVTLWINSNGGSLYEASQIYTALKEHKGKITVKIDGTAISAASIIAMAGDEVLMSPTSVMMIHNPWSWAEGDVEDMKKTIGMLEQAKEDCMNAYQLKTGRSRKDISELMDADTWMGPKKAIEEGFADGMLYESAVDEKISAGVIDGARMVFAGAKRPSLQEVLESHKKVIDESHGQVPVDAYTKLIRINERRSTL